MASPISGVNSDPNNQPDQLQELLERMNQNQSRIQEVQEELARLAQEQSQIQQDLIQMQAAQAQAPEPPQPVQQAAPPEPVQQVAPVQPTWVEPVAQSRWSDEELETFKKANETMSRMEAERDRDGKTLPAASEPATIAHLDKANETLVNGITGIDKELAEIEARRDNLNRVKRTIELRDAQAARFNKSFSPLDKLKLLMNRVTFGTMFNAVAERHSEHKKLLAKYDNELSRSEYKTERQVDEALKTQEYKDLYANELKEERAQLVDQQKAVGAAKDLYVKDGAKEYEKLDKNRESFLEKVSPERRPQAQAALDARDSYIREVHGGKRVTEHQIREGVASLKETRNELQNKLEELKATANKLEKAEPHVATLKRARADSFEHETFGPKAEQQQETRKLQSPAVRLFEKVLSGVGLGPDKDRAATPAENPERTARKEIARIFGGMKEYDKADAFWNDRGAAQLNEVQREIADLNGRIEKGDNVIGAYDQLHAIDREMQLGLGLTKEKEQEQVLEAR